MWDLRLHFWRHKIFCADVVFEQFVWRRTLGASKINQFYEPVVSDDNVLHVKYRDVNREDVLGA